MVDSGLTLDLLYLAEKQKTAYSCCFKLAQKGSSGFEIWFGLQEFFSVKGEVRLFLNI